MGGRKTNSAATAAPTPSRSLVGGRQPRPTAAIPAAVASPPKNTPKSSSALTMAGDSLGIDNMGPPATAGGPKTIATTSAVMLAKKSTTVEMTRAEMTRPERPSRHMACIPPGFAESALVLAVMGRGPQE